MGSCVSLDVGLGHLEATALSVDVSLKSRGATEAASASRAEALSGTDLALLPLPARTRTIPLRSPKVMSWKGEVLRALDLNSKAETCFDGEVPPVLHFQRAELLVLA